jgi:hypothetical protein
VTRLGSPKKAKLNDASGRLAKARAYQKAAKNGLELWEDGDLADPIISSIVLAAVGYADAVTAKLSSEINQGDHDGVIPLLAKAAGARLTPPDRRRLERILKEKAEAQYGARPGRKATADERFADLEKFAAWAEALLKSW